MTNVLRLNAFIIFVYQEANYLCCMKCFIIFHRFATLRYR